MADESQVPAEEEQPAGPEGEPAVDESQGAPQEPAPEDAQLTDEDIDQLRADEQPFRWQASEYVHHHKSASWYAGLAAFVAVLVGIVALLRWWDDIALFGVMALAIVVYANKPPKLVTYELTREGLRIDDKDYRYSDFRSFGVLPDVDWHTIDLEPTRRFSPRISVLFGNDDLQTIVSHLELHLPRVDRKPDLIEQATRYVRF